MILCVPIIIAVKLGYHIWINNITVEAFDFDKAYFVATIMSIVIFISNIRSHKDYKNLPFKDNIKGEPLCYQVKELSYGN
jgi:hypothetical protein